MEGGMKTSASTQSGLKQLEVERFGKPVVREGSDAKWKRPQGFVHVGDDLHRRSDAQANGTRMMDESAGQMEQQETHSLRWRRQILCRKRNALESRHYVMADNS